MQADVVVIGGGPSGCVAAARLAAAGIRVLILEEHAAIGQPVDCSGIIGTEAFEALPLPRNVILHELRSLELVSPSGKRAPFDPGRTLAYVVDRAAFDQELARLASDAGAQLWLQATASRLDIRADGAAVTVQRASRTETVTAHAVILAGGPRYQFQEQLGMGRPAKYLKTVQAIVPGAVGERAEIYLGSAIAGGSFAWRLPVPCAGITKIGVSATADSRTAFAAFARMLREQGRLAEVPVGRPWMIPISPVRRAYADRVVAVGDAAGQTKPTTGGGLYYGLLCAQLAADTLIEALAAGDVSAPFLSRYEKRWRRVLGREITTAHRFRAVFERLTDLEMDALFDLVHEHGLLELFEREADFDWHRHLILQTLRRPPLARVLFRNRGAALSSFLS